MDGPVRDCVVVIGPEMIPFVFYLPVCLFNDFPCQSSQVQLSLIFRERIRFGIIYYGLPIALGVMASAGAIAGIGALLGQSIGAAINAVMVGPQGAADMMRSLGLETGAGPAAQSGYWFGIIASTLCISVFNVLIMAGMGALGGLLWWQFTGSKGAGGTGESIIE